MSGNQNTFQMTMKQGHTAAWDQSWSQAANFYRAALEEIPNHPAALTSLALALYEMEDYEGAALCYLDASQVSPSDPVPFEKLALIYQRQSLVNETLRASIQAADLYLKAHDVEKSIENWRRVLSLQESLLARTRLAVIYDRTGRKPEAVTEYLASAALLQHAGDLAKAIQVAAYAAQLMPEHVESQRTLNLLRTNRTLSLPARPRTGATGPLKKARKPQLATPQATALDPIQEARALAVSQLAGLLFDRAEEDEPIENQNRGKGIIAITKGTGALRAVRAERARILIHLNQAIEAQTNGQEPLAAEELERAMELGLKQPAIFFNLGLLNLQSDPQKALRFLLQAAKHPQFELAANLLIGNIQFSENNLPAASAALIQALRLADLTSVPPSLTAELNQLYELIIEDLSHQTDPLVLRRLCETITLQLIRPAWRAFMVTARQQLPAQAAGSPPQPLAEMILDSQSSQVVERLAQVRSLAKQNKITAAMEEAYHALQYAPNYLPLHIQIGDLLLSDGRPQDAIAKFILVAELYNLRGERSQAIQLLNRVLQLSPMHVSARNQLIHLLHSQNRFTEAVQQYLNLAEMHLRLTDLDSARQSFAAALKTAQSARLDHATSIEILLKIADLDSQRLEYRAAIRSLEQVCALDPNNFTVRNQLIDLLFRIAQDHTALIEINNTITLLDKSGNPQRSVEFVQEWIAARPEKLELRRFLAAIFHRQGKADLAAEQLEAMARGLIALGKRADAVVVLNAILAMKPTNQAKYQNILQKLR